MIRQKILKIPKSSQSRFRQLVASRTKGDYRAKISPTTASR